jgi:hypothetical protein
MVASFRATAAVNHGGMMCGSGGGAEGGIEAGGEVFCSMKILALINHGGCRRPTATMRPHSQRGSIQQSATQSANMLLGNNRLVSLKFEKVINSNVN